MGEYEPASISPAQPVQAISTPIEKMPFLKLQTAGPANVAYLEQDSSGSVYLYFGGLRFGVDDYVPDSLIRSQAISQSGTAGELVCRQMLTGYGYHEDKWPLLARRFLLQHSAHPDAGSARTSNPNHRHFNKKAGKALPPFPARLSPLWVVPGATLG